MQLVKTQISEGILSLLASLVSKEGGRIAVCLKCHREFYTRRRSETVCIDCKKGITQEDAYLCEICGKAVAKKGGPGRFCHTCKQKRKKKNGGESKKSK